MVSSECSINSLHGNKTGSKEKIRMNHAAKQKILGSLPIGPITIYIIGVYHEHSIILVNIEENKISRRQVPHFQSF